MSQQAKSAMDAAQAVNVFTKTLMWKITEGHPVDQEEIDALNSMREGAGMKKLNISVPSGGSSAPRQERQAPPREAPRKAPKKPSHEQENEDSYAPHAIMVNGQHFEGQMLPDNSQWTNRFYIKSESSGRLYTIAQNKSRRYWGCSCPGWISRRKCKHLTAMGLPGHEQPYEAQIAKGASKTGAIKIADDNYQEVAYHLAAELIHSDTELSKMMEPAVPVADGVSGVAHIDGPEAGPSNDEMHANQHEDNGVPVMDGNLVSPERQNVTAIKDAIEGKAEMEIGKPISQKQEEVDLATEVRDEKAMHPGATEVSAKPGTQIIINVGSKKKADNEGGAWSISGVTPNHEKNEDVNKALKRMKATTIQTEGIGGENQPGATSGQGGGMFGGTDLEGPNFHVGFTFRGTKREASFSSIKEAHKFIKSASAKFGKLAGNWTMKCPNCKGQAQKDKPEDSYKCGCGWNSHTAVSEQPTTPKKASVKKAKQVKTVDPDPAFVEAMVNAVLHDHGARAMELQIPLARLVSIIKTKIKKVVRGNTAIISIYVPENDTEYVMQLPKEQAQEGNYKFQPHTAAADPAKRNLVLEILKQGPKTTGEVEKALGGGKYTMYAHPVLQELLKEGLLKHKQMRWHLKAAAIDDEGNAVEKPTKSYTDVGADNREAVGKFAATFGKKALSLEVRVSETNKTDVQGSIISKLNTFFADLKQKNPQGYMDSFEQQLPSRMMGIAKSMGLQMDYKPEADTYLFYDQAASSTKGKSHEELTQQASDKTAYPRKKKMPTQAERELGAKALRLELDAKNQGAVGIAWTNGGLFGVHNADERHPQEQVRELVKQAIANGWNAQIMFMEQKDADSTECVICHELFAEPSEDEHFSSLKSAMIRVTSVKGMPSKGSPEWHQLQIAIQTMKMPDPMVGVMGGPDKAESERTLAQYGLMWDDAAYMSGGKGVKKAGEGMAKIVEVEKDAAAEKEAGFNFFFPGQVLEEFYPELQHEIVDYPNSSNQPMSGAGNPEIVGDGGHELEGMLDEALGNHGVVEMIQLPADVGELEEVHVSADYSSTSPAGGMGIGRDGKPEVLEGAPLRKENDIRGQMFTDEFYGQYEGIPGAAMNVASKTAAEGDEAKQFGLFLKKVCGEIAATLVAAFKVTARPLLDKVPGIGEMQLDTIEQGSNSMPLGNVTQGGRVKYLMDKLNDGDIKAAINDAWAQAAVWNDSGDGGFVYEVFVRPETIDTESLKMKYKFVCGTRE
jgi:hypothetical protein